jgi:hypothetical protein
VSEQKHTGGTWVALEECIWAEFPEGGKESVATTKGWFLDRQKAKANAARIVQCVNACAGIEDPEAAIEQARQVLREAVGLQMQPLSSYVKIALEALTPKEKT